jgi:hypothetical protein
MQEFEQATMQRPTDAMSDAEAQEVLRLYLKRSEGAPQHSVAEVAQAVRLPEDEVRCLLADVRQAKRAEDLLKVPVGVRRRKLRDSGVAFVAAASFVVMGIGLVAWGFSPGGFSIPRRHNEVEQIFTTDNGSDVRVVPSGNDLKIEIAGNQMVVPSRIEPLEVGQNQDLSQVVSSSLEQKFDRWYAPAESTFEISPGQVIADIKSGRFDRRGLQLIPVTIAIHGTKLTVTEDLPAATIDWPEVKDLVKVEREKRIKKMLEMLSTKARVEQGTPEAPIPTN